MKRKICMILSLLIILSTYNLVFAGTDSVKANTKVIKIDGIDKKVNIVTVDLDNEDIALKVVTGNDKVQGNESFQSMINRKKPLAAINGNYFASYDTLNPYGTIIKNGEITYLEGANTSFIVREDNQVDIDNFGSTVKGYIDGHRKNEYNNKTQSMDFYLFDVWYINTPPLDKSGVYLYNSERGESINLPDGVVIEVIKDKITKVIRNSGQTKIPKDGYLLYYAKDIASDKYINSRFKIGSTIELEYEISISNSEEKPNKIETKDKEELLSKQTKLFGSIDKNTKNIWNNNKNAMDFYIFNIWYINSNPTDSKGVYLYTPDKAETLDTPVGKAITVDKGIITKVDLNTSKIHIPKDGFVIYYGKDAVEDKYITNRFNVGQTVDFYNEKTLRIDTENIIKKAVADNNSALKEEQKLENDKIGLNGEDGKINLGSIENMISAGPFLVNNNKILIDEKVDKGRAQRSALGITEDNKLVLLTGNNLNMIELSKIMVELNCIKAMNLDGGASSALYANEKIVTQPGRKLNTVLMVHKNDKAKVLQK